MFTGLVQAVGRVAGIEPSAAGVRLRIDVSPWGHRARREESISVNGVCLTVAADPAAAAPSLLDFDVIPETLAMTTLGALSAGSRVNLEHAVTASTLMGGHVVQGHIDTVGTVERVQREGDGGVRVRIRADEVREYLIPKGSIAVDGVSLTIAATGGRDGWFEVALIPTTLERTTLDALREGDRINIEADAMAKSVVYWLREFGGRGSA